MFCQQCGAENRIGARFCASCGAPLTSGNELTRDSRDSPRATQNAANSGDQTINYSQNLISTQPIQKRHWTVTVAFVIWVLAIISNMATTFLGFLIRYDPQIGVGLLLTILSAMTAYNMYDADREGLYTGIAAIIIALAWDIFLLNVVSIVVVIIIAIFTIVASPHLVKDGIRAHNSKISQVP